MVSGIIMQFPLPGLIEIAPEPEPGQLTAPEWVMEQLREAVIRRLPEDVPPPLRAWIDDARAGRFDGGPLMQAAIAGWMIGRGR